MTVIQSLLLMLVHLPLLPLLSLYFNRALFTAVPYRESERERKKETERESTEGDIVEVHRE